MAGMETPQPTDAHKKLHYFAGSWKGDDVMPPGPWSPTPVPAQSSVTFAIGQNGMILKSEYEYWDEVMVPKGTYSGHGVYGYDTEAELYTMHWFDSHRGTSGVHRAEGTWVGDTLTMIERGAKMWHRSTYRIVDANTYTHKMESSSDGGATWTTFLESTTTRA